jgi:DNA topoisomerase-1
MAKTLVIVESPAKAKTIEKYLGKDFKVMASYGHVRDLIPKEGAVNPNDHFKMAYQMIDRNMRHVEAIKKALKTYDALYLATDPDREGEAIAWHLQQWLSEQKSLDHKTFSRIVFHQITKKAVQEAIQHPSDISMDLVHAQQARRALDFLFGFNLSPELWHKIRPGLSAGRVQSPALGRIVEREIEIENFKTQEYWTLHADLLAQEHPFSARLIEYQQQKIEQFSIIDEKHALETQEAIRAAAKGELKVVRVVKKERKRYPAPPFTTSTMQQEAVRKLGFSTYKAMQVAQQLYEGIEVGEEGRMGLITYMRTDSVSLAPEAVSDIRALIEKKYGKENLPSEARFYKTKSKNAQEAHEAIRPTSAVLTPENLRKYLSADQLKLYTLIWKRAIACQMSEAVFNTVAVDLAAPNALFRANGSTLLKPGFIAVYQETLDDPRSDNEDDKMLPSIEEGEIVSLQDIKAEQHFTDPPPRYTEASLVKALEEDGIGRPSTYASIIATLKNRKYVDMDNKRFVATDVGRVVNRFLKNYFTKYVDYGFTAQLEDELDAIARGEKDWISVLENFWGPFKSLVDVTKKTVKRSDVTQEKMDEACPKCGLPLSIRLGKRGRFVGCTAYPDCDYTRNLSEDAAPEKPEMVEGRVCPQCQSSLVIKSGRYGRFIGCSNYPNCHFIEPLDKPKDMDVTCPKCKQGHILQRKSRRGKIFYSCERYPKCDYATWDPPIAESCPKCHWPILTIKTTKRSGSEKVCPQKNCDFKVPYSKSDESDE